MHSQSPTACRGPSVLFVCLGNICRSPIAEAILRHKDPSLHVDSAGTSNYHIGSPPDERGRAVLASHNITTKHRGRRIGPEDFERFDYVLCMDDNNLRDCRKMREQCRCSEGSEKAVLKLFSEYDTDPQGPPYVKDPYYGTEEDFEDVFEQLQRCAEGFLKTIQGPVLN